MIPRLEPEGLTYSQVEQALAQVAKMQGTTPDKVKIYDDDRNEVSQADFFKALNLPGPANSKAELIEMAEARGIEIPSRATKADILKALA